MDRYAFARANDVRLIDEFDLIERHLHIFRAFSPTSFRRRVENLSKLIPNTWGIRIDSGVASAEGDLAHHDRAKGLLRLMKRFAGELPDMLIWYNPFDNPWVMVPWEERDRLDKLIQAGQCGSPCFIPSCLIRFVSVPPAPRRQLTASYHRRRRRRDFAGHQIPRTATRTRYGSYMPTALRRPRSRLRIRRSQP